MHTVSRNSLSFYGHVTRLKLSMGPIRGPYSLQAYPRHVRASMLPKKETKYSYNAFQMIIYLKMTTSHWKRNEDTHLGYYKCEKKSHYTGVYAPKYQKNFWQPRWKMISPVIFAGALTIFAGALPPWAPPWWRGCLFNGKKLSEYRLKFDNENKTKQLVQSAGYGVEKFSQRDT